MADLPCGADGRAVRLMKFVDTPGSDPEADAYTVFVGKPGDSCECKGYLRHQHCRHIEAVQALLANGWLSRAELANGEADVSNTETDDGAKSPPMKIPAQPELMSDSDISPSPTPAERFIRDCYPAATIEATAGGFVVVLLGEPITAPRPTAAAAWMAANDVARGTFRGEGS